MSPGDVRRRLCAAGFAPIPVNGKAPRIDGWQKLTDVTEHDIQWWGRTRPAETNTGVLTARTPFLDLDILDPDAASAAEQLVRERYGEKGVVLARFGKRPKRAIPFRCDQPFAKVAVTFVTEPGAPGEKIEMLGDGQQCVVHGVHPDTKLNYEWFGGSLDETKREDLPYIRAEEAQELVNDIVALLVEQFGYRIAGARRKPHAHTHIWRSKDFDFPCTPTGEKWTDAADGKTYVKVRQADGAESVVPVDELLPANGGADWIVDHSDHDQLAAHAMRLVRSGMNPGACVNFLRAQVAALVGVDEDRRKRRLAEIPGMVDSAVEKIEAEKRPPPPVGPPSTLTQTLVVFDKWLSLKDHTPVLAAFGAVAANHLDGDPVWLGVVAPPSSAKTEIINSLSSLPDVAPVATLTIAALLSGTPRKDRDKTAKGGLLRKIGDFGILALKDFGSILSMRPDAKAELLAAMREIADGAWTRHLGTDGGKTLAWKGKLGLVFGVTPAIDAYHGVIGSLGDRWLLTRMAPVKGQLEKAFVHRGASTKTMREELADAVARLFAGRRTEPRDINPTEIERLDRVCSLVVRLRGTVERDRRTGELDMIYGAEGTARIGLALERLLAGLDTLGVERESALKVIESVALDSVPPQRRAAYAFVANHRDLAAAAKPATTTEVATALDLPTITARRVLEDLAAYRLIKRVSGGQGKADEWSKTDWETED